MKFKATTPAEHRAGFTLAEVLAALVFMAIVIPVAVEGVRVAGRAGEVGLRKDAATRIAQRVLNEQVALNQTQSPAQNGVVEENGISYQWTLQQEQWNGDPLNQLNQITVQVRFPVQGRDYDVRLSTLQDPAAQNTTQ